VYHEKFEEIINYFNDNYPAELANARKTFFNKTGEIFDDDDFYDDRSANYLAWFLFDRPFNGEVSAIQFYYNKTADQLEKKDRETLKAFCRPIHSLFVIKRLAPKKDLVVLKDLSDCAKYKVTERRNLAGLTRGDIIEGRLMQKHDITFFLDVFVYHPKGSRPFIKKQMKLMRKKGTENFKPFMLLLQKLWMQSQRYSHVATKNIYSVEYMDKLNGV